MTILPNKKMFQKDKIVEYVMGFFCINHGYCLKPFKNDKGNFDSHFINQKFDMDGKQYKQADSRTCTAKK